MFKYMQQTFMVNFDKGAVLKMCVCFIITTVIKPLNVAVSWNMRSSDGNLVAHGCGT